jgi:hypothetical protein
VWQQCGYLLDPHTAVAKSVADNIVKATAASNVNTEEPPPPPMLIYSTAHYAKFPEVVVEAVTGTTAQAKPSLAQQLQELRRLGPKPGMSSLTFYLFLHPVVFIFFQKCTLRLRRPALVRLNTLRCAHQTSIQLSMKSPNFCAAQFQPERFDGMKLLHYYHESLRRSVHRFFILGCDFFL